MRFVVMAKATRDVEAGVLQRRQLLEGGGNCNNQTAAGARLKPATSAT